ncbi:response regulator transcription factor [Streptomyces sp. AK02-01A]|uniref:helix-turn-helix transcriptional regulator n=1 Tax=Streptomyces sp. AK02-01A TaxID=3028648 RepID=UPI00299FCD48|nr:response regulator transcription factor [Streptomyces sp. AK02-01A]MDX3850972.1 response regulator transcription factor [Streptomyces sp. AK02-01A]
MAVKNVLSRLPSVAIVADDPLVRDGAAAYIEADERVEALPNDQLAHADVVILVVDEVTGETLSCLNRISRHTNGAARIVLVTDEISEGQLALGVAYGVMSLLPRSRTALAQVVSAAVESHSGRAELPSELVGRLAALIRTMHREDGALRPLSPAGLVPRELDVLRLLAEGFDTVEIAAKLSYSERSIKTIIHDLTKRLGLRNRTHAVAYAMRSGLV